MVFHHESAFRIQHLQKHLFQMGTLFPVHAIGSLIGNMQQGELEIQLRQRWHKVCRMHDNLLWNVGYRQKNRCPSTSGTAVTHSPAGNHIPSVQALQYGNNEEALLQQIYRHTNQVCGRFVPGDLSRAIPALHRQNEPPLPSQPAHYAGHHHRCSLRAALHGTDFCADIQGRGLQLERGIQALLIIKRVSYGALLIKIAYHQ